MAAARREIPPGALHHGATDQSEQQECIMTYFIFAVLLNRTLIVPPLAVAQHTGLNLVWPWTTVFNLPRLHTCLAPSYGPHTILLLPDYLTRSHSPHAYVSHLVCLKPTCNHEWTLRVLLRENPGIKLADKKGRPAAVNQSLVDRMGKVRLERLLEAVRVVEEEEGREGEEGRAEEEEGRTDGERGEKGEGQEEKALGIVEKKEEGTGQPGGSGEAGGMAVGGGNSGKAAETRRLLKEANNGAEERGVRAAAAAAAASQAPPPSAAAIAAAPEATTTQEPTVYAAPETSTAGAMATPSAAAQAAPPPPEAAAAAAVASPTPPEAAAAAALAAAAPPPPPAPAVAVAAAAPAAAAPGGDENSDLPAGHILTFGDLAGTSVIGHDWLLESALPLVTVPPDCSNLWRPHAAVMAFVDGFIAAHLGSQYMAVHLRRDDFYGHLKKQSYKRHVFLPIAAVGTFILSRAAAAGLNTVLLATDGTAAEVDMLTRMITATNATRLVTLHESRFAWSDTHSEPWGQALLALEHSMPEGGGKGVVRALAEKYICARAHVFYGTVYSSFSTDIIRIRAAEGMANCMDGKVGEEG
ncbi:hypothetical protein CLOM_g6807 [Closterium sp. NIES-68]|nr:hypothetical protein CLOM_g6807 [Closterium sp. NIES-68]GJP73708.1 hypothetical protein CLOP_g4400 [Closterium sp. NIES-67]